MIMLSKLPKRIKTLSLKCFRVSILCVLIISSDLLAEVDIEKIPENKPESKLEPKIKVSSEPPPGFEDLILAQTTQVDVYYANEKIGNTLATYSPTSIELSDPADLTALIPHLIDPETILQALSGELDTNASEVCLSELQRECGTLTPNVAGVIFDESRFRLYVFVNRLQLQQQGLVSNKFLPNVKSDNISSVNAFSNSFSGEDSDTSYTVGANHIISRGQSRLQTQWDYSDTRDFSIETLSLQNDNAGIAKEVGFFNTDTRFTSFTNNLDIAGARIYSSTNTRTDLDYSQATEIFLFLDSRSQVEVFKDNKLLDGGFYEAGNQQLDTLRLPSGSYPITLRITNASGNTREEQFFFVKTSSLPPQDQPLHFLELGLLEKDSDDEGVPGISDNELLRVGTAYRLQNHLGGSIEYLHSTDTDLIQGGLSYYGSGFFLQNSLMLGSDNEWGLQFLGQYRLKNISLNFDYRQIDSAYDDENDFDEEIEARILPNDFSQGNISASIPVRKGQLTLRTQYNDNLNEGSTTSYGLDYRYPLFNRNRFMVELNLSSAYEEDDYRIQTGLRFTRTKPGEYLNIHPSYVSRKTNNKTEQGPLLFSSLTKTEDSPKFGRITYGGFLSEELERTTVGARTQHSSSYGRADLQLDWVNDDERGSITRFRGLQNTNIITNGKEVVFGGDRNANSGVIIELHGQSVDEPFEIFVDGHPRGHTKNGGRTALMLDAFNTYSISIRSKSNNLLHFDDTPKRITLYPGNVETISFEIQPIVVLITRLLLADKSPASRVRIDNAIGYAMTDEHGWLQAEISGTKPLEISKNGKLICTIDLPELEIKQDIAFVDSLQCNK